METNFEYRLNGFFLASGGDGVLYGASLYDCKFRHYTEFAMCRGSRLPAAGGYRGMPSNGRRYVPRAAAGGSGYRIRAVCRGIAMPAAGSPGRSAGRPAGKPG